MAEKDKPYTIHFVCRGNAHRSRLAAAYFNTLVGDQFRVTSSGIAASEGKIKTISAYTRAIARKHGLHSGISGHTTQTTDKLLAEADVVIFMNKDVYDDAARMFTVDVRKTLVWHVADVEDAAKTKALAAHSEQALVDLAAPAYTKIRKDCGELKEYLTHTAWVDVVDAHNQPTDLRLPMGWITDRGLWHRGVHVVAQTVDGKYVVGKRDNHIVFAPGMLEISLGGGVDSGEHPLEAAVRETHEELGIHMLAKHFRPLFMYKQIGYHPHYHKQTRCHLYVYHVRLPVHSRELKPQPDEVAELRAISRRQLKHLLHAHRLQHFGRLKWGYKLYDKAIAYSQLPV